MHHGTLTRSSLWHDAAFKRGRGADEFLGRQGDPFDTQKDLFCAWLGAMAAQAWPGRRRDRQLAARVGASR